MYSAPGIYHGSLNFDSTSDDFVAGASLLPYPPVPASARRTNAGPGAPPDLPISTVLTEFHFVLLYRDRVLALGALDEALAYEAVLPLKPGEQARGLAADPVRGTYWVYTDQTLFELGAQDEARDVWRAYLARGQHDLALRHATVRDKSRLRATLPTLTRCGADGDAARRCACEPGQCALRGRPVLPRRAGVRAVLNAV
jgi:hypothetical protein